MANGTSQPYQRLPGTGYRRIVPVWVILLLFFVMGIFALLLRGRRVQLWLGNDHLLLVESDGYREYYKRFRYQDIQVLMVRRTSEGKVINGILGFVCFGFAALAVTASNGVGTTLLLILAGLFALIWLANVLSGPTCRCHLRTAVQTEELSSVTRLRHARQTLERLRPFIVAAQGELAAEELSAQTPDLRPAENAVSPRYIVDDPQAPPRIVP